MTPPTLSLSLAQWSLHRAFEANERDVREFAAIARQEFHFSAVEYVNQFYKDHGTDQAFWKDMKQRADREQVRSLLIMVDNEGDLGNTDESLRHEAVINHHKWVDAAEILGCHSIRVNAFGDGEKEAVRQSMIKSMKELGGYAAAKKINVIIENHGLYSADGKWVTSVLHDAGMKNCGTLPDFGNWCLSAKWGSTMIPCDEVYDRYQGVTEFLPYAKGVSAKSYDFDDAGEETTIDYRKMLMIVRASNFAGYIGVEYEGNRLTEPQGIVATKSLLEKLLKDSN